MATILSRKFKNRIKIVENGYDAIFSQNGRYILSGVKKPWPFKKATKTGHRPDIWNVKMNDMMTGKKIRTYNTNYFVDVYATFSPEGKEVLTASYKEATIWDVRTGKRLKSFNLPADVMNAFRSVAYSPDDKYIATGTHDQGVILWEKNNGEEIAKLKLNSLDAREIEFSPDGSSILVVDGNIAHIFAIPTGELLKSLIGHKDFIKGAVFSPDGKNIVTGSLDNTAAIWDVASGDILKIIESKYGEVTDLKINRKGDYLILAGNGPEVIFWNLKRNKSKI